MSRLRSEPQRLTAIILTYQKGWIFERFLASFRAQIRQPDEILLVDDASDDSTKNILRGLAPELPVRFLPENLGQSLARNIGLAATNGDLVVFLDADIEMRPEMLESLEIALRLNAQASFSYCHYDRKGALHHTQKARQWSLDTLKTGNYISACSMVRRAHLPNPAFDPTIRKYEDWDLWLRMGKEGRIGILVDRVLFDAWYRASDVTPSTEDAPWRRFVEKKNGLCSGSRGRTGPAGRDFTGLPEGDKDGQTTDR